MCWYPVVAGISLLLLCCLLTRVLAAAAAAAAARSVLNTVATTPQSQSTR